ncbi:adenine-specific DNA-methyltransferase [Salinibacter ruber]|uniref:site-specific DNA-methyltransferase n=1 Tax=Salinibacter ruber TaxID=146919 RepID=UPI0021676A43|nr:site-specific DNA-methyltransferase [Salinibacter ruber]MCS3665056.1 adenine-specific DNA-methyltransferase [Salinibacter ruber]
MTTSESPVSQELQDFQDLLRDLFQFDVADLDFGVYRILNEKREDIKRFIKEDLVKGVRKELRAFEEGKIEKLKEEVEAERQNVRQYISADAIRPDGSVSDDVNRDLGAIQDYLDARERLESAKLSKETERRIYDDLARFFNRYYDSGDFVTKRRFAAGDSKYYVPYDGEEVLLHWANRDQYYVKTTEHFRDYRFSVRDVDVHFQLVDAQVPQDNVKASDTRYFVLQGADPVEVDADAKMCTIRFAYRPITKEEDEVLLERYNEGKSKSNRRKTNDRSTIVEATTEQILDAIDDATVRANLGQPEEGEEKSPLRRHLNRYTAKHTADYFVHKDLGGFLRGQLEFFIQNEVLQLDDVLEASEQRRTHQVDRAKVVKKIGERIIDFLAQIENFQKRLFEKKKFVVDTGYCVTLDRVPDTLYDDILENDDQLDEWRDLYSVEDWDNGLFSQGYEDGAFTRDFLEAHPHVMIDTRHFDQSFVDTLLDHLSDLDDEGLSEVVDGLCIQGENFQALNLLRERFKEKVDCVYIDPPYNTGNDGFLYKDTYRHSSWMSMIGDRVPPTADLLSEEGVFLLSCDDNEEHRLRNMMETVMPSVDFMSNLVWKSRQNVDSRSKDNISNDHEFILAYGSSLRGAEKDLDKYSNTDEDPRGPWMSDNMVGLATRARRPNLHFHILVGEIDSMSTDSGSTSLTIDGREYTVDQENVVGEKPESGDLGFICLTLDKETGLAAGVVPPPRDGREVHHSLYTCPDKGWRHDPISMAEKITDSRVLWPSSPDGRPRKKKFQFELESQFTGFSSYVGFTRDGTSELADLFRTEIEISFPKPTSLIETLVEQSAGSDGIIMDYFAGSGTTGHAVMAMNHDDEVEGDDRRYLLVELDDYFDTIMMPRLKKAVLTDDWDEGVPQDRNGQSHVIKYHRLESYEDALNNIKVEKPDTELDLMDRFDDYALHYMLPTATSESDTLLAPEAFEKPFDYNLRIQHGMESPTAREVDLESTFNYLIGLEVETRRVYEHQGRRYVAVTGQVEREQSIDEIMVVWRDQGDLDLDEEREWAADTLPDGPFDTVYVNGPSHIHGKAEPTEIVFRERMDPAAG